MTPAGEHQYDIQFDVQGLPAPSTLGAYRTYVAWATTPQMHPVVKLGVIGNGRTTLGRITFDRTLILISAEASESVSERSGRLVLRGTSAAVRMQPHDLAYLLAGLLDRADAPAADHAHHAARRLDTAAHASASVDAAGLDDVAAGRRAIRAREG